MLAQRRFHVFRNLDGRTRAWGVRDGWIDPDVVVLEPPLFPGLVLENAEVDGAVLGPEEIRDRVTQWRDDPDRRIELRQNMAHDFLHCFLRRARALIRASKRHRISGIVGLQTSGVVGDTRRRHRRSPGKGAARTRGGARTGYHLQSSVERTVGAPPALIGLVARSLRLLVTNRDSSRTE